MRALLLVSIAAMGCGARHYDRAAVENGVRAFAQTVAQDVSRDGPAAWRKHFADTPAFFMAVDGHLEYADSAAATQGIQGVTRVIKQITLQWGEGLRVDPLAADLAVMAAPYHEVMVNAEGGRVEARGYFTATVENRDGRWQFRNAHWSDPVR